MAGLSTKVAGTLVPVRSAPVVITVRDVGEVSFWPTAVVPAGWLKCDGSAVSRVTYSELFAVIGTTFGAGDGATTFNLPPANGKVLVGHDGTQVEFDVIGETGGTKAVTLTANQSGIQAHTHSLPLANAPGVGGAGDQPQRAATSSGDGAFRSGGVAANSSSYNSTAYPSGKDATEAHTNLQPYLTLVPMIRAVAQTVKPAVGGIITNPAFEQASASGAPLGWQPHNGAGTLSTDTTIKFDGTRAAKIDTTTGFLDVRSSLFRVAGGQMVTVKMKVRAATAATVMFTPTLITAPGNETPAILPGGPSGSTAVQYGGSAQPPASWVERSATFVVPPGHETAALLIGFTGSGIGYVDDVDVAIGVPTAPFIVDRDPVVAVATTGNVTLSGTQTVDGYTPAAGDSILVWRQDVGQLNGVYVYNPSGPWPRHSAWDTLAKIGGREFIVRNGTAWGGWTIKCTNAAQGVIDVVGIDFVRRHAGRILANRYANGGGGVITNTGITQSFTGIQALGAAPAETATIRCAVSVNGRASMNAAGYWYFYTRPNSSAGFVQQQAVRFHNNADIYRNFAFTLSTSLDAMPGEPWEFYVTASMDAGGASMDSPGYWSMHAEYIGGK